MSKTKNWIMDMEDQYYEIAEKEIAGCEHPSEFVAAMAKHQDLLIPQYDAMEIEDILGEMWWEHTHKYL